MREKTARGHVAEWEYVFAMVCLNQRTFSVGEWVRAHPEMEQLLIDDSVQLFREAALIVDKNPITNEPRAMVYDFWNNILQAKTTLPAGLSEECVLCGNAMGAAQGGVRVLVYLMDKHKIPKLSDDETGLPQHPTDFLPYDDWLITAAQTYLEEEIRGIAANMQDTLSESQEVDTDAPPPISSSEMLARIKAARNRRMAFHKRRAAECGICRSLYVAKYGGEQ